MGTIRKGVNGGFSGKAGSVIGAHWKSIDYIRGLSKKSNKPASEAQLIQQARFYTIAKFIMPIAPFVEVGFSQVNSERMTGVNAAIQANMKAAIAGAYPNFALDYAKIKISSGSLQPGGNVYASVNSGILTMGWSDQAIQMQKGSLDDVVHILLYLPSLDEFLTAPKPPVRGDATIDIELPDYFLGEKGHLWLFFTDRKNERISRTTYLGEYDLI
ncbi:DUF6266 family protein [Sphingobacterium siyangense]|uniref:Uncharacterized protein n=1 Tax=Sphingobacterium siyangense TaxID=459529 RepID=A0A562MMZ3_9SPHI|nr:DUF6266 family protein [Sphingobacterium siyangense]TWI21178.1 hypothetical protein IQ31_01994 [Sphingobacterium siyangense]